MNKRKKLLLFALIIASLPPLVTFALSQREKTKSGYATVVVTPLPPEESTAKDSLQMGTFDFVTAVPTQESQTPDTTDGSNNGSGDGGAKGNCGTVVEWAQKISDKLKIGGGGRLSGSGYDNLTEPITSDCGSTTPRSKQLGQYWCTWLIVDSYNLAGTPIARNASVIAMHKWWKKAAGFTYVNYASKQNLKNVKPGYAMFLESRPGVHTGHEHVAMVKEITVDARGNGTIVTLEANASKKSKTLPVSGWMVKNTTYPARGFGGK